MAPIDRALPGAIALLAVACSGGTSSSSPSTSPDAGTPPISSSSPLCKGSGRCVAISARATETEISGAFAQVKDGYTLALAAGTYQFSNQLALGTANNVTVVGAGEGKTILDFHGQKVGGDDGLFAQSVKGLT